MYGETIVIGKCISDSCVIVYIHYIYISLIRGNIFFLIVQLIHANKMLH